jgi:hypothetical protein
VDFEGDGRGNNDRTGFSFVVSGSGPAKARTIARRVIEDELVMEELFRLLAWTEIEILERFQAAIHTALCQKRHLLDAVASATFGRDYVAMGEEGDASRLDIPLGDALAESFSGYIAVRGAGNGSIASQAERVLSAAGKPLYPFEIADRMAAQGWDKEPPKRTAAVTNAMRNNIHIFLRHDDGRWGLRG